MDPSLPPLHQKPEDELKRKRQRLVHPNFEALGACDACSTKRIRCMRLQAHDATCESCLKRNIVCQNLRNNGLKYKPRAKKSNAEKLASADHSALVASDHARPKNVAPKASHPSYLSWGSCDACHKRRVGCVRLDPDDPVCEGCRKRKRTCTKLRNDGLRYKPRARKSESSSGLSGSHGSSASCSSSRRSSLPAADEGGSLTSPSEHSTQLVRLTDHSAEGRLGLSEESSALLGTLLDSYFESSSFAPPTLKWGVLRNRFERAGRRLYQMDPFSETLVRLCVTFAAHTSDHPLILGHDAPRLSELNKTQGPLDLSKWSLRRAAFCNNLVDDIVDLVDRRAVFRMPATETVSILALMSELWRFIGKGDRILPYRSGAVSHIRLMKDEHAQATDLQGSASWSLVINDAFESLIIGRMFSVSDEDLDELLGLNAIPPPTLEMARYAVGSAVRSEYGPVIACHWAQFIRVARYVSRETSIPLRKGRAISAQDWLQAHRQTSNLLRLSISARNLAQRLAALTSPHVAASQAEFFGASLASHLSALALSVVALYFVMYGKFKEHQDREAILRQLDPMAFYPDDAAHYELEVSMSATLVEALLFMAHVLRLPDLHRIESLTSHLSLLANVQSTFDVALKLALAVPAAEEGGPVAYSKAIKIEIAQTFVNALLLQGWTFPEKTAPAKEGSAAIEALRATPSLDTWLPDASLASPILPITMSLDSAALTVSATPFVLDDLGILDAGATGLQATLTVPTKDFGAPPASLPGEDLKRLVQLCPTLWPSCPHAPSSSQRPVHGAF